MDYGNIVMRPYERAFLSMFIRNSLPVYVTIEQDALEFIVWVSKPQYSKIAFIIRPKKLK